MFFFVGDAQQVGAAGGGRGQDDDNSVYVLVFYYTKYDRRPHGIWRALRCDRVMVMMTSASRGFVFAGVLAAEGMVYICWSLARLQQRHAHRAVCLSIITRTRYV